MGGGQNEIDPLDHAPPKVNNSVIDEISKSLKLKNSELKITEKNGKGENYLGKIYRGIICGISDSGQEKFYNLILKFAHTNALLRERFPLQIMYKREAFIYNTFLPSIDEYQKTVNVPKSEHFRFAKCYATDVTTLSEVIVMEDLGVENFKMFDRLEPLDLDHTILIIKNLAKFHALSFAIKDRQAHIYKEAVKHKFYISDFGDGFTESIDRCVDTCIKSIEDPDHKARFAKFGDNFLREMSVSLDVEDEECPYKVICHGDCWNNNFLFRYKESKPVEVIILDWQIARYASPVTDLSYFIYVSTDKALRDAHLNDIYNIYYQSLKNHLGLLDVDVDKCYPEHVFRQQIKQKSTTGLIWASILLPITLNSREEAMDLDDILEKHNENSDFSLMLSPQCKTRINEVVAEFVEMGVI